ncbi:hypothetical protein FAF44_50345, partial [Nonomuraea sp. MG754425]|uniref:hypothetical protein n=1 Tax=Nonomuraea sp. MG754425 TaxID=2570319 RepID=UPI001F218EBD
MRHNRRRLWPTTALTSLFIVLMAGTPAGASPDLIVTASAAQAPVKPSEPDEVEPVPGRTFVPPPARHRLDLV